MSRLVSSLQRTLMRQQQQQRLRLRVQHNLTARRNYGTASLPLAIEACENLLQTVQLSTGLPWWAAISLTSITLRTCITLPLSIISQRNAARRESLKPVINAWAQSIASEQRQQASVLTMSTPDQFSKHVNKLARRRASEVFFKHGCHPMFGLLLPLTQIPLFVAMSIAIRDMCGTPALFVEHPHGLQALLPGGESQAAWLLSLSEPDPWFVLPVAVGASYLGNILLGASTAAAAGVTSGSTAKIQTILQRVMIGVSVAMIPVAAVQPSAVCVYWLSSGVFSLVQQAIFRVPAVRKKLGFIPLKMKSNK